MPFVGQPGVTRLERRIDFSATGMALIEDATMALLDIPEGSIVLGSMVKVNTAQATITSIDLGLSATGANNTGLQSTIDVSTVGWKSDTDLPASPIPVTADTQLVVTNQDAQTLNAADMTFVVLVSYPKQ